MAEPMRDPNPQDWTDSTGAAEIMGVGVSTIHDYVKRGVLARFTIGGVYLYWVADVHELAVARDRMKARLV